MMLTSTPITHVCIDRLVMKPLRTDVRQHFADEAVFAMTLSVWQSNWRFL